jgi:pimeloyl-ACP methyl ester carboxylesterase
MKISHRFESPFWKGCKLAIVYYLAAVIVFLVLKLALPMRHDAYLFFLFVPVVIVTGLIWAIISLITSFFRVKARGTLLVHAIILVMVFMLLPPKPPAFPKSTPNEFRGELMPTFHLLEDQRKFLSDYQTELSSWQVPVKESDITTEFGKTHIVSFGNPLGKPLILLHWFYSNSTEWKYMAPFLQEHYCVYAVDIIGDMGKSYAYNPPKNDKEISTWFNQVTDSLGLKKVALCGHSNGGFQAMIIAQQNPDKVDKLILLAPASGLMPFSLKFYLSSFGTALYPKDIILEIFKKSGTIKPDLWSKEMTEMLTISFRAAANQLRVYPREFTDEEIRSIKAPTLLILGEKEMIYSPKKAAGRASQILPDSRVVMLPGCGHAIPLDAPEEASKAINSFLISEQ